MRQATIDFHRKINCEAAFDGVYGRFDKATKIWNFISFSKKVIIV